MKQFCHFLLLFFILFSASPCIAANSPVYLDAVAGSDSNDGSSAAQAVQSFERALVLLQENGTVYFCQTVVVTEKETYTLAEKGANAHIQPIPGFKGPLFSVGSGGELTFSDITLEVNGAAVPYLEIDSGSSCTVHSGTVMRGSHIISLLGGSIDNSGTLTMDGGEISADSSVTINNLGVMTVSGGTISAGAPPSGKYYYALSNLFGTVNAKNCVIRAGSPATRAINHNSSSSLNLGSGTQITGSVVLSQNAFLTITEPLGNVPPIALEPESGLIPWAYHGAILVKPADSTILTPGQFTLKAPGFVLQSTTQGDLMLRDPATADVTASLTYSSLTHSDGVLFGGAYASLVNNTAAFQPITAVLVFYRQGGSFAAAQFLPMILATGAQDASFTGIALPEEDAEIAAARLYIWKSVPLLEPLCAPLSVPISG